MHGAFLLLTTATLVMANPTSHAKATGSFQRVAEQEPADAAPRAAPQGQFLAQVRQMRVERIQQDLGVSPQQASTMADRWGAWDRAFMERARQLMQLRARFNEILISAGNEEDKGARLKPLVAQFVELRQQQEDARRQFETEILQSLTPAQQARMILLVEDIQNRIRQNLREMRQGGNRF